jgi:hypothetical protein
MSDAITDILLNMILLSKRKFEEKEQDSDEDSDGEETKGPPTKRQHKVKEGTIHVFCNNTVRPVRIFNTMTRQQLESSIRLSFFTHIDQNDTFMLYDVYDHILPKDGSIPFNSFVRLQLITKAGFTKKEVARRYRIKEEVADVITKMNESLCMMIAEYAESGFGYIGAKCDIWCPATAKYWIGTVVQREGIRLQIKFDGWPDRYNQWHTVDLPEQLVGGGHPPAEVGSFTGDQGLRAATFNVIPWDCKECKCTDIPSHLYKCPECKAIRKLVPTQFTWPCPVSACNFVNQEHHAHCEICYAFKPTIHSVCDMLRSILMA